MAKATNNKQPFAAFIGGEIIYDNLNSLVKKSQASPDPKRIQALFQGRYPTTHTTIYKTILHPPLGHSIEQTTDKAFQLKRDWWLNPEADDLILKNDNAYLEKFSELMHEAVQHCLKGAKNPALELSGGLDSASILTTSQQLNQNLTCYMHVTGKNKKHVDDSHIAKQSLKHLNLNPAEYIDEKNFDLWHELEYCAKLFSGPAPILLPMLSQNIWRRVSENGHDVLLSGAGGDACVSSHAKNYAFLPALLKQQGLRSTWQELQTEQNQPIRNAAKLLGHLNPRAFRLMRFLQKGKHKLQNPFSPPALQGAITSARYFASPRAHESAILQGHLSQNLQMRLAYSQTLTQNLGFEIRYPLLYPPLLDFCHRLPLEQKRRLGVTRFIMRRYLAQHLPEMLYNKRTKQGGIIPATLGLCQTLYQNGELAKHCQDSPYHHLIKHPNPHKEMANYLFAYMLQFAPP